MGGGASTLSRLRKAVVIRAYNLREPDQSLDQQFRPFAVRSIDGKLYITTQNIRSCLRMESKEYEWMDHLFQHTFGGQVSEIDYTNFIQFLESGKPPVLDDGPSPKTSGKQKAHSAASSSGHKLSVDPSPGLPVPPANAGLTSSSSHRSIADASAIHIERTREAKSDREDDEENVISINLSSIASNPQSLPDSLKLQTDAVDRYFAHGGGEEEDSYSLIIHPSSSSSKLSNAGAVDSQPKPLWRKRETVRQERTVHYTTIDASGEQQELVEKETTQSEVLHMECKETGEFAHRETTQYEQMETFNEEVVAESKGAEEYVHLKSLEDEYHYMESTMPNRKDGQGQGEQQQQPGEGEQYGADGEGGFREGRMPTGMPGEEGEGQAGELSAEAAAQQAAMEAEYAEAYELYQQKQRQDQSGAEEEDGQYPGGDSGRAHRTRGPSPRPPPPFSDDAGQEYGFGSGTSGIAASGSGRPMDMQDAFAFAAAMDAGDDGDNSVALHNSGGDQLFGEMVDIADEDDSASDRGGHGGVGAASASFNGKGASYDRSHLFDPQVDTSVGSVPAATTTAAAVPAAVAPQQADEGGYLSRCSSYESLHEID